MATNDRRPKMPRPRAHHTWHCWVDTGEAWDRADLPKPQTIVGGFTAEEVAVEAYNILRHITKGDPATIIVKCVDDPLVGTERPYWSIKVECKPCVVDLAAETLDALCDDVPTKPGEVTS